MSHPVEEKIQKISSKDIEFSQTSFVYSLLIGRLTTVRLRDTAFTVALTAVSLELRP